MATATMDATAADARVLERQLELTFARLPAVNLALPVIGAVVWVVLRDRLPTSLLGGWFATLCVFALSNFSVGWSYRRQVNPNARRWSLVRILSAAFTALLLGGCFATLLFVPGDIVSQTFLIFVVGGTTVTSVASTSAHPPSLVVFQLCNVLPMVLRLALEDGAAHHGMAGLIGAFLAVVMLIGLRVGKDQTRLIQMEAQNRGLVESLKQAHEELTRANDELSARVRERTAQLERSLAEQEEQAAALRQAQRMEAVGRLAGGVAHDFNNVLTSIAGFAGLVHASMPESDERREDIAEILAATDRASGMTRQLLAFAKGGLTKPRVVDLSVGVFQLEKMLRRVLPDNVDLAWRTTEQPCRVLLDPGELDQLVTNLVVNACDAMPRGGTVTISVDAEEFPPSEANATLHAVLRVRDTGSGIPADLVDHVFDPFVSTKGTRGTGLGLTSCFGIVKRAGGVLRVETEVDVGTVFSAYLPITALPSSLEVPVSLRPGDVASASIVVVDDEPAIPKMVRRLLRAKGHSVETASTAEAALELIRALPKPPDLVLSDVVLPQMSGFELRRSLHSEGVDCKFLFMSGYIDEEIRQRSGAAEGCQLLRKPFSAERLVSAVTEALTAQSETAEPAND